MSREKFIKTKCSDRKTDKISKYLNASQLKTIFSLASIGTFGDEGLCYPPQKYL